MGLGASDIDGRELIELINSENTKQTKYGSIEDIAEYLRELDIPAEILMIALLQDVSSKLECLNGILEKLDSTEQYIKHIAE